MSLSVVVVVVVCSSFVISSLFMFNITMELHGMMICLLHLLLCARGAQDFDQIFMTCQILVCAQQVFHT